MTDYAIGDIQGCCTPLQRLLEEIDFDPRRDRLWFAGDIVNRGPDSLAALRLVRGLDEAAVVVLGNHDLHLLAVAHGAKRLRRKDTLAGIFAAPDAAELLDWLRHRPLFHREPAHPAYVLAHAGIPPQWDIAAAADRAAEVETALRRHPEAFFAELYGNHPDRWSESLAGAERLRFITNALTRMRYCSADGRLLLDCSGPPSRAPAGYYPWFSAPGRCPLDATVICGHWSSLGFHRSSDALAIDTGCLWGGTLTALRLDDEQVFAVPCAATLTPG